MNIPISSPRRVVQYRYGDPLSVLHVENDVEVPALSEGEVRVRVSRSIIHPGDLQLIESKFSQPAPDILDDRVPGLEAAGTIEDAAPSALKGSGLSIGSRVIFFAPSAWQSRVNVPAGSLVGIPDDLPDSVATQLLINTITAKHVVKAGREALWGASPYIVQTGAASAVGKLITVLALKSGLIPIRLVRSHESAVRLAKALPGGKIIDTSSADWHQSVRQAISGDISVIFDGIGGPLLGDIAALLDDGGTVISYGSLAGRMSDLNMFVPKSLTLRGVNIGTWNRDSTPGERSEVKAEALRIARDMPEIFAGFKEFDLTDLGGAIKAVSAPNKSGNVILRF